MGVGPSIDYDRVAAMLGAGIPAGAIAERLGHTERQIRRIMRLRGLRRTGPSIARYLGTEAEIALWREWLRRTGSYEEVAFIFGVRKNTVWFKLGLHQSN
ncbi:hypothetical protein JW777_00785 [bacterium]|nr:hypothetical protein [bacterium]